jgi:hypothetical protein
MRSIALATALAVALSSCTFVGMGVASGTVAIHNASVDEPDAWSYKGPLLGGALVGLAVDIVFVWFLNRQWSKRLT